MNREKKKNIVRVRYIHLDFQLFVIISFIHDVYRRKCEIVKMSLSSRHAKWPRVCERTTVLEHVLKFTQVSTVQNSIAENI